MISRRPRKGRRLSAVAAAVTLAAATVGFGGASVGADDAPTIPDVPSLGFSIDPSEGAVGSTVNGQVNVDDVAQHCITDPTEFARQFVGLDGDINDAPYARAGNAFMAEIGGPGAIASLLATDPAYAYAILVSAGLGDRIHADAADPQGVIDGAMEATFIMGFVDLATLRPIAPYGGFDPTTGEGSTPVPDIDGGSHVVIATCVGIPENMTAEQYGAMVQAGADFIEANYDMESFGMADVQAEGTTIAMAMLPAIVEPLALGVAPFCVDDGAGSCDEAPPVTEPGGNEPGTGTGAGTGSGSGTGNGSGNGPGFGTGNAAVGSAGPATPVSAAPTHAG